MMTIQSLERKSLIYFSNISFFSTFVSSIFLRFCKTAIFDEIATNLWGAKKITSLVNVVIKGLYIPSLRHVSFVFTCGYSVGEGITTILSGFFLRLGYVTVKLNYATKKLLISIQLNKNLLQACISTTCQFGLKESAMTSILNEF